MVKKKKKNDGRSKFLQMEELVGNTFFVLNQKNK